MGRAGFSILRKEGLSWTYFNEINSNPRDYQVSEGAKRYLAEGCDVVMAIGGGSPMDAAKGIATVASNGGEVNDYEGANRIQQPLPPMVFMPSTAGSGADISQFAIITDSRRKVKMSIISRTLVPNISITDPVLLTTKPTELIISSAIDALSHAVEAYVSPIASTLTETQSLKAIDLILNHLPSPSRTVRWIPWRSCPARVLLPVWPSVTPAWGSIMPWPTRWAASWTWPTA